MSCFITSLFIYPIKSCQGIPLSSLELMPKGPKHDRRTMVVNEAGKFLSQRDFPQMARVELGICPVRGIFYHLPGVSSDPEWLNKFSNAQMEKMTVTVWNSTLVANKFPEEISNKWSQYLGTKAHLVFIDESTPRINQGSDVGFADGYPLLFTSEESLEELNKRLDWPVSMNRFRPNVVVKGLKKAFDEDHWQNFQINQTNFTMMKPCSRCIIVDTHQQTGERIPGVLKTLNTFRKVENKVNFGVNVVQTGNGIIKVGDLVKFI